MPVNLHVARDGEQALILLSDPDFKPNLIILDLNLPKITGTTLLRRWSPGETPVVVFTSYFDSVEQQYLLTLGARQIIPKPTDIDDFRDAVYGMVQKWVMPQAPGMMKA